MAHIPIDLPDQSIHIHAQRELAFEVVAALGPTEEKRGQGGSAKSKLDSAPAVKIIATNSDRQLVEFNTPLKLGPVRKTWKTTEWVSPMPPLSIDFNLLPDRGFIAGGLRELVDRFEFEDEGGCTVLTYKSRFGIRWSIGGWVLGKVLFGPVIRNHMIDHLAEVKVLVENRAKRSRIYPLRDCTVGDE